MQLEQITSFEPTKYAYFMNSEHICVDVHPSCQYFAFTTRTHEVILHNDKNGHTKILYHSEHGIIYLKFTHDMLLVVEKGVHEILAFSLKTAKIKKKITGHRSQVITLDYCRQNDLFASISHDVCLVFNQKNLVRQKVLKCSTSSFFDCLFSPSGQYLFTSFKDGSIFIWKIQDYTYQQESIQQNNLKLASNYSSLLVAYHSSSLYVADLSQKNVNYQKIDPFWKQKIVKVDFVEHLMAIHTEKQFYLCELENEGSFKLTNISKINNEVNTFYVGSYGTILIIISKKYKMIQLMKVVDSKNLKPVQVKNPLTNKGLYCCGGFSSQNGCNITKNIPKTHSGPYFQPEFQMQALNAQTYNKNKQFIFTKNKLKDFVRKHHILPHKHRASSYQFLLNLPIDPQQFKLLERKGRHQCAQTLNVKYPLKNRKLKEAMKNIISLLAHHNPLFGEAENIPQIIFPIVCLFGQDQFLCFQILYRLLSHWLSFIFSQFPTANSQYLQNMYQIFQKADMEMVNHLKFNNISFTKLSWGILSNFLTNNFPQQAYQAVLDSLFTRPQAPELSIFVCLAYLIYNKSCIMSFNGEQDLDKFLSHQHTINTGKYLHLVFKLYEKYKSKVTYKFNMKYFETNHYLMMQQYPIEAVQMYSGKRKILLEQYHSLQQQQNYKDKMFAEMENMTVQAKRNSEQQQIQKQSYNYHCEQQAKNIIQVSGVNKKQRISRLKALIDELTEALQAEKQKNEAVHLNLPLVKGLQMQSDSHLDEIESELMKLLMQLKNSSYQPIKQQPLSFNRSNMIGPEGYKTYINSHISNKLHQLDQIHVNNEKQKWQNDMLKSIKK